MIIEQEKNFEKDRQLNLKVKLAEIFMTISFISTFIAAFPAVLFGALFASSETSTIVMIAPWYLLAISFAFYWLFSMRKNGIASCIAGIFPTLCISLFLIYQSVHPH